MTIDRLTKLMVIGVGCVLLVPSVAVDADATGRPSKRISVFTASSPRRRPHPKATISCSAPPTLFVAEATRDIPTRPR